MINRISTLPQNGDIRAWVEKQMETNKLTTLLAFADDGVIWGDWDGKKLITSHEVDPEYAELRDLTLQQAYLFNTKMEVRLFRDEIGNWKAFQLEDSGEIIQESQILWGDKPNEKKSTHPAFISLLAERKGIPPQLIPIKASLNEDECVRLAVHHMVEYTDAGEAYIAISRLAGLSIGKKAEEV